MIINSKTDIENYVTDDHYDVVSAGLHRQLVSDIQDADHPAYGTDWSEWLDREIDELKADLIPGGTTWYKHPSRN